MSDTILNARDLVIGRDGIQLSQALNFSLKMGELVCLLGPNGVGKSTLIHTLCGNLPKISGDVSCFENDLFNISVRERAKILSVVFTKFPTNNYLLVREILEFARAPFKRKLNRLESTDVELINKMSAFVGIEKLLETNFVKLSDGQKQKVMITRALVQDTPLILLDEPASFLDIPTKMEIVKLLKAIAKDYKKAILFTGHDWHLALEMLSRIWIMGENKDLEMGLPEDLILDGTIEKSFQTEKIKFDKYSGHFFEVLDFKKNIFVCGDIHPKKYWCYHALKKNGINPTSNESDTKLEVLEVGYLYEEKHYDSLEEVIKIIC